MLRENPICNRATGFLIIKYFTVHDLLRLVAVNSAFKNLLPITPKQWAALRYFISCYQHVNIFFGEDKHADTSRKWLEKSSLCRSSAMSCREQLYAVDNYEKTIATFERMVADSVLSCGVDFRDKVFLLIFPKIINPSLTSEIVETIIGVEDVGGGISFFCEEVGSVSAECNQTRMIIKMVMFFELILKTQAMQQNVNILAEKVKDISSVGESDLAAELKMEGYIPHPNEHIKQVYKSQLYGHFTGGVIFRILASALKMSEIALTATKLIYEKEQERQSCCDSDDVSYCGIMPPPPSPIRFDTTFVPGARVFDSVSMYCEEEGNKIEYSVIYKANQPSPVQ